MASLKCVVILAVFLNAYSLISAEDDINKSEETSVENSTDAQNSTGPQDLYVIKTVVYEVGILTDASNDTDNDTTTHEKVDLSFYNGGQNGSEIDLTKIPLPIQTNVSGVEVTGILPSHIGALLQASNGSLRLNSSVPVLPNKQVTITHNISTSDPQRGSEIISNLPHILGLDKIVTTTPQSVTDEN